MEKFKQYMLVHHNQMDREGQLIGKTFRIIPLMGDSAYLTGEYDLKLNKLVLATRVIKDELQSIPKMAPNGDFVKAKVSSPGNPPYEFERRMIPELWEVHMDDPTSIDAFLQATCFNSDKFPYQMYLSQIDTSEVEKSKIFIP